MPDEGKIEWAKNVKVGYLDQHAALKEGMTIRDVLSSAFDSLYEMEARMNELYDKMADATEEEMTEYMEETGTIQDLLTNHDFYMIDAKVEEVARALGLLDLGLDRDVTELSGGQRTKILLGKLLLEKPDILLLDEPTNYLDSEHIEWLKRYLQNYENAFILISHDIPFLNNVINIIYHMDGQYHSLDRYVGDYDKFTEVYEMKKAQREAAYNRQQQEIAELVGFLEVAAEQRADLLRAQIVGVVIAAAEHVGTEHDAAEHLVAEPFAARLLVGRIDVCRVRAAVAVADAVEPRQVRARLGRGDDVVARHGVFRVRQRDVDEGRAEGTEHLDGVVHDLLDGGVHAFKLVVFLRKADLHAVEARICFERPQVGGKSFRLLRQARRILLVVTGDQVENRGGIPHGAGKRANLVQRGRERHEAVPGDASVGRFEADHAAERRGLADGAAGIGTERGDRFKRGDRRGRPARGAARHAVEVPRVRGALVRAVLAGGAHGELVHVGAAEQDASGGFQFAGHEGIVRGDEALQDLRGAGALLARRADIIFERDRDAVEVAQRSTCGAACVGSGGLRQHGFRVHGEEGAHLRLDRLNAFEESRAEHDGGGAAVAERGGGIAEGQGNELGVRHAMPSPGRTCGTFTSSPSIRSGALASMASRGKGSEGTSSRSTLVRATAWAVGSMPETSSSASIST